MQVCVVIESLEALLPCALILLYDGLNISDGII